MDSVNLNEIPAFPRVVQQVLGLLSNDNVQVPELARVVESDPMFATKLLAIANSPLFGFRAQIESVQMAIVTLGLTRLQTLAVSVSAADYMRTEMRVKELHRCWRHTLASAAISRSLARACSKLEARAYTAGLLHDVGRLGLLVARPREYAAMLRDTQESTSALLEREEELFGVDHCTAGGFLVKSWNLPAELALVAAHHHEAPNGNSSDLVLQASLACRIADAMGFSVTGFHTRTDLESICGVLPKHAKKAFLAGSETLKAAIILNLEAQDLSALSAARSTAEEFEDPDGAAMLIASAAAKKPTLFKGLWRA
jgi:HD-like signal output (HDOD) protein